MEKLRAFTETVAIVCSIYVMRNLGQFVCPMCKVNPLLEAPQNYVACNSCKQNCEVHEVLSSPSSIHIPAFAISGPPPTSYHTEKPDAVLLPA